MTDCDVLVVGGGAMGSSTAYHLLRADPSVSVMVVERDSSYRHASTVLSDGNVRIQFNLEENIRMSQHAMEVLADFGDVMATVDHRPEVSARHQGNLFLADDAGVAAARSGMELQSSLGCDVEWLTTEQIGDRWEALRSHDLVGGTFGRLDGSVDPNAVLRGYRNKAIELGAEYVEDEVREIHLSGDLVIGARLGSGTISADVVVATAGAWTADLLRPLGIDLPVEPVMRTVYVVSSTVPVDGLPSLFLPSGVYALPESGTTWVMAWCRAEDPVGYDFTPASHARFDELIWPELHAHLPVFDSLRVESSWAGLYDVNTLDGNAILGPWPGIGNLHVATGFSGHGFQQCPAVGRYLAEGILGEPHVIDLGRLGPERIIENRPLHEHRGRLI